MSEGLESSLRVDVAFPRVYADDLEAAIQETLTKLADIDRAYEKRFAALKALPQSDGQERLRAKVESLHQSDRKPLVLRLADLHYRVMRATLFRTVH